ISPQVRIASSFAINAGNQSDLPRKTNSLTFTYTTWQEFCGKLFTVTSYQLRVTKVSTLLCTGNW
ncbi:MAG: hypothetical protein WBB28_14745, partial [Crinalium sp.]